jgi:hypothetical protein
MKLRSPRSRDTMALIMMSAGRGLAVGVPAPPRLRPHAVVRQAPCPRILRRYRHLQAQARVLSANQITGRDYSGGIVISRHRQESSQPIRLRGENAVQLASSTTPSVSSSPGTGKSTAKTQYRKFETNNPRKRIARPQSQFPHSCVFERFIYSHDRSTYFIAGESVDRSWEYTV